jgi:hypothetical protein
MIVIYVLVGILINMVVGGAVWVALDDEDESLYKWYSSCPPKVAWFVQPLVLTLWPVGLFFYYKNSKGLKK